jgi:hypothetical protein
VRDEAEASERRIQPRSNSSSQQLSLSSLQLNVKGLVIILEVEAMFIGSHQMVFKGCFENTNKCQMVSRFSNEVGHHLWLQGPLNHLSKK